MQTAEHASAKASATVPGIAPLLVSAEEAFRAIGVGRTKGYELIGEGALVAKKIGSRTLITVDSLQRFVASLPTLPAKAA